VRKRERRPWYSEKEEEEEEVKVQCGVFQ